MEIAAKSSTGAPIHPQAGVEKVGEVGADRVCITCGYNLIGQVTYREPHYGLIIARCPECGTAASLQEYPLLGRWAARWAWVFAGLWLTVLLVFFAVTVAGGYGIAEGAGGSASDTLGVLIGREFAEWVKVQVEEAKELESSLVLNRASQAQPWYWTNAISDPDSPYTYLDPAWKYDVSDIIVRNGGLWKVINWRALVTWEAAALFALACGIVWAVILPHVRGWRFLWVVGAYAVVWGGVVLVLWITPSPSVTFSGTTYSRSVAEPFISPWFSALTLGFMCVVMIAGLLIGRKVARLVVRAALHPKWRGPFAYLWTADGLRVPVTSALSGRTRGG